MVHDAGVEPRLPHHPVPGRAVHAIDEKVGVSDRRLHRRGGVNRNGADDAGSPGAAPAVGPDYDGAAVNRAAVCGRPGSIGGVTND